MTEVWKCLQLYEYPVNTTQQAWGLHPAADMLDRSGETGDHQVFIQSMGCCVTSEDSGCEDSGGTGTQGCSRSDMRTGVDER